MSNKLAYNTIAHLLPLFHQPWWLDAVCEGNWDVVLLKDDGEIVAAWPYRIEKKLGFNLLRNPLLTPYLGPFWISAKAQSKTWLQDLFHQLPKVHFAQWTCTPEFAESALLQLKNIEHQQRVTYCINLKLSEVAIWENIHPKRRNAIRKAQSDLIVERKMMDIDAFVQWQKSAFDEKKNSYPFTSDFLSRVLQKAIFMKASLSYSVADKDGKELGQIWLAFDDVKVYYLLSATPAQTHRGAIALLIWTAIMESKKMGLCVFDFEGSMDEGIAHFFHRFGGVKKSYSNYSITNSPLWKLKQKLQG